MVNEEHVADIVSVLTELTSDSTLPRNVKQRLSEVLSILNEPEEISLKVDKALQELEEVTDDNNLLPHVRTQIWNLVSMLEKSDI